MKSVRKLSSALMALIMCVAICLSLASCTKKGPTVEEYIADNQTEIQQLKDTFEPMFKSQGMEVEMNITARENSMVFTFQFKEDLGVDNETLKTVLEPLTENMSSSLDGVLAQLKEEVPSADSIIMEFLDMEGNQIIEVKSPK